MTHPNATPACTEAGHAVGGSWPLPRPGPAPLTAEPLWPASPRSPGTPTSPYTQEGEGGGRVSAGPARSGGGPGVGGWGYLQARRALPRGRPRPALQLCPAGKRRPSGPAARVPQPGAWGLASALPSPGKEVTYQFSLLALGPCSSRETLWVRRQRSGVRATPSAESTPKGCGALAASLAWMRKPHSGTHGGSPALEHPGAPSQAPLRGTGTHR